MVKFNFLSRDSNVAAFSLYIYIYITIKSKIKEILARDESAAVRRIGGCLVTGLALGMTIFPGSHQSWSGVRSYDNV